MAGTNGNRPSLPLASKPYIQSLTINGINVENPIIRYAQLVGWENDLPEVNVVIENE